MNKFYVPVAAASACILAQLLKPVGHYLIHRNWNPRLVFSSGDMPSSHSALVSALTLAIGLTDGFDTNVFYISLCFSVIVCYDAANVRFYAGKNISVTQKLIDDLKDLFGSNIVLNDKIYMDKMKGVLGHTYFEVTGGVILGLIVSYLYYIWFTGAF
ncbi:MAG: divergent PAP2 family protein [Bacillota bacterium]|jgi:acid phosphatase family membrane protein YuiD|nr:divergent PAP2 family protein [Bacillota bacterium]NLL26611.1 divergent PAP2 family protein [Erysipelotrichia bacterium]